MSLIHEFQVDFSYLEPQHLNRYRVASIDPSIPRLAGRVVRVSYFDIFGRPLTWAHGSADFVLVNGGLTNGRVIFRDPE